MKKQFILLTAFLFLTFAFLGCSKITPENYEKIKVGMTYEQVTAVIGQPDKCDAALGAKNCIWGNEKKNITVKFIADKVVLPTMQGI